VRTFRISTNTLGNGFIECVANETLLAIRDAQPAEIRGTAVMVAVLEGRNQAVEEIVSASRDEFVEVNEEGHGG